MSRAKLTFFVVFLSLANLLRDHYIWVSKRLHERLVASMRILLGEFRGIAMFYVYFTHFITIIMTDSEGIASFFFANMKIVVKLWGSRVCAPRGGPFAQRCGGEGGIRTHGCVSATQYFQHCTISHSVTSPRPRLSL